MSQGVSQFPCSICGHGGHRASNCKEIGIPPDGFYKPAPGQHQHDDDCEDAIPRFYNKHEDEMIHLAQLLYSYKFWLINVVNHAKTKKLFLP